MTLVTDTWRTTWPTSLPEGGAPVLTAVLRDEAGQPVPGPTMHEVRLTLFDRTSLAIINSRADLDVKSMVSGSGVLTFPMAPADIVIMTDDRSLEWHVARIRYSWSGGTKQWFHELHHAVANLALLPVTP